MSRKKESKSKKENPTVALKLKPYLKEFLICKLQEEIHYSSRKSIIGAIIEPLVEYIPKGTNPSTKSEDDFTFTIPYNFNKLDARQHTIYISEHNQRIFERILNLYFKEVFFSYMDDKVRYHNEIQKCILLFCSDYNITFNKINFESLKKAYYRYRQKKTPQNCPWLVP